MRDFVIEIGQYARNTNPDFIVIPQNGNELAAINGEISGSPAADYLNSIDGTGREDLFYGYVDDNVPTPESDRIYMTAFLDIAEAAGVQALVTDYCWSENYIDDSYEQNHAKNYISFAADHRELDNIPSYPGQPFNLNDADVSSLDQAQNFLYILNPGQYSDKSDFIAALSQTDYDVLIIDLFFSDTEILNPADIAALKTKNNGGSRLVIAYMSIGEAEDYRYYWDSGWLSNPPLWMMGENPYWPGNYKVTYWDDDWQQIIYGDEDSYTGRILAAGFDGVYLDIIDAFEYFENL